LLTQVASNKLRRLYFTGDGRRSVYDKKPQHYAEDNTAAFNCTSEAAVKIIKYWDRCIVLLKLTTDGHKASRGLSATAELLVTIIGNMAVRSSH